MRRGCRTRSQRPECCRLGAADVVGFLQYDGGPLPCFAVQWPCEPENPVPVMLAQVPAAGVGQAWRGRLGGRIGNAHNGSVFLFSGEGLALQSAGAAQYPGYQYDEVLLIARSDVNGRRAQRTAGLLVPRRGSVGQGRPRCPALRRLPTITPS